MWEIKFMKNTLVDQNATKLNSKLSGSCFWSGCVVELTRNDFSLLNWRKKEDRKKVWILSHN